MLLPFTLSVPHTRSAFVRTLFWLKRRCHDCRGALCACAQRQTQKFEYVLFYFFR